MRLLLQCFCFGLILMSTHQLLQAQAFCALRDPASQIYELFPSATSYRSSVRTVDKAARSAVRKSLDQELYYSELGRHTLYLVYAKSKPLGVVHVRSERSEWGLVEIAWALDLDLQILDFCFQRCRNPLKHELAEESFQKKLRGLGLEELKTQLAQGALSEASPKAAPLVQTLLLCATKTVVVTDCVWKQELQKLRLLGRALKQFGAGARTERLAQKLTHDNLVGEVEVLRVRNQTGSTLGVLACWVSSELGVVWWAFSEAGDIRSVEREGGWPDELTKRDFESLPSQENCSSGSAVAVQALRELVQPYLGGEP